jgi:hypothetical protein
MSQSAQEGRDSGREDVPGFSAVGHLASTLATQFREAHPLPGEAINGFTERPDVAILRYPVVLSFAAAYSHKGSARNLLGLGATKEQLAPPTLPAAQPRRAVVSPRRRRKGR